MQSAASLGTNPGTSAGSHTQVLFYLPQNSLPGMYLDHKAGRQCGLVVHEGPGQLHFVDSSFVPQHMRNRLHLCTRHAPGHTHMCEPGTYDNVSLPHAKHQKARPPGSTIRHQASTRHPFCSRSKESRNLLTHQALVPAAFCAHARLMSYKQGLAMVWTAAQCFETRLHCLRCRKPTMRAT